MMDALALSTATYLVALSAILGLSAGLSAPDLRKRMACLGAIGWGFACIKIWLVHQTPQWTDIPADSLTYQRHASALLAHWQGRLVDAQQLHLTGLLKVGVGSAQNFWSTQDRHAYGWVLGAGEWLYPAWLGLWKLLSPNWQTWATYSNALFAAFFPVAAYGITHGLVNNKKIAALAAGLTLLDPGAGINAAWLLKDSLACFLALSALWSGFQLWQRVQTHTLIIFVLSIGALGAVRYVGYVALILAALLCILRLLTQTQWRRSLLLLISLGCITQVYAVFYAFPKRPNVSAMISSSSQPLKGGVQILKQARAEALIEQTSQSAAAEIKNPAVHSWLTRLQQKPLRTAIVSIARTLFAPYPWSLLKTGLTYHQQMELYAIGNIFWILCLPGLFLGLFSFTRKQLSHPTLIWLVMNLLLLLGAYTLFMGEWSTRQRIYMMPVFLVFTSIGLTRLTRWIQPYFKNCTADAVQSTAIR